MATVKLENVTKRYGKKEVLKKLTFEVKDKEFFCIIGPPGAGKTTTLRIIAGVETAEEGNIYINGEVVNEMPPKYRDVAMFFETLALYPNKTGFENIAFPLRIRKTPENEIKERVLEVARMLRVEYLLDREPRTFSGGEMQRVALARTIIRKPRVFLLDEPLSNIDALLRINMRAELKRLQKELGQTVIYATHDQAEAMAMGERVCVMDAGEAWQIDPPHKIYNNPRNKRVAALVGSPPMNFIDCTYEEGDGKAYLNEGVFKVDVTRFRDVIRQQSTSPELTLGIRPEDVRILDKPTKESFEAAVYVTEPLGVKTIVNLSIGKGSIIKAMGSPGVPYRVGDKKWVELKPEKLHVIDRKTESVIV